MVTSPGCGLGLSRGIYCFTARFKVSSWLLAVAPGYSRMCWLGTACSTMRNGEDDMLGLLFLCDPGERHGKRYPRTPRGVLNGDVARRRWRSRGPLDRRAFAQDQLPKELFTCSDLFHSALRGLMSRLRETSLTFMLSLKIDITDVFVYLNLDCQWVRLNMRSYVSAALPSCYVNFDACQRAIKMKQNRKPSHNEGSS